MSSFNDHRKPHMARGDFMWGGYAVVIDDNVPRLHLGDTIEPIPRHWLRRVLYEFWYRQPAPPKGYRRTGKIEEDQVLQSGDKLFMSAALWAELRTVK